MKTKEVILDLVNNKGELVQKKKEVDIWGLSDLPSLCEDYDLWRKTNKKQKAGKCRGQNIPETLSECLICATLGLVRTNNLKIAGVNTSFDAYNLETKETVQCKSSSVRIDKKNGDCTSFGPKAKEDVLLMTDFYREGKWDKTFDIYVIYKKAHKEIREYIKKIIVNQEKNETVEIQKATGKRPRFSIFHELIHKGIYINKRTFQLTETEIILLDVNYNN